MKKLLQFLKSLEGSEKFRQFHDWLFFRMSNQVWEGISRILEIVTWTVIAATLNGIGIRTEKPAIQTFSAIMLFLVVYGIFISLSQAFFPILGKLSRNENRRLSKVWSSVCALVVTIVYWGVTLYWIFPLFEAFVIEILVAFSRSSNP